MELWHLLVLGHILLLSVGTYLGKVLIHKIHATQILFYQYIASIITVTLLITWLRPDAQFGDTPFMFLGIGFMYAFGITALYNAKRESLSKSQIAKKLDTLIIFALSIPILGEYALFGFGSPEEIKKTFGFFLTLLILLLFMAPKTHLGSEKTFNYKNWIKWIAAAVLIQGVAKFLVKVGVDSFDPLQILQLQYIGSLTMIIVFLFAKKRTIQISEKRIVAALLIGVFVASSLAMFYSALALTTATQGFSIVAIGKTIAAVLLGAVFFKEKITPRMLVLFGLGLVAIYLLG